MARTAVVAGTATAVSNRVSRRQAGRWAAQEQQQYAEQPPQQYVQQPQYAPPPPPPPAPAPSANDTLDQLQKLGELKAAGVLTEAEFAAQKAKILAG
jgi:hypothetical protein